MAEELDLDELEQIARAATPGLWLATGRYVGTRPDRGFVADCRRFPGDNGEDMSAINAGYIATFDPPTVLKLIALARLNPPAASGGEETQGLRSSRDLKPTAAAQDADTP